MASSSASTPTTSASVLELRISLPISSAEVKQQCARWPEKDFNSSWIKHNVEKIDVTSTDGIAGDAPGFPSHIEDYLSRVVMVLHQSIYTRLAELFPRATSTLVPGGFGENMLVSHPSLQPEVVCIGDVFDIGTAQFEVSGPRKPCPKVSTWHDIKELNDFVNQHGWAGYFLRVLRNGAVKVGDEVKLVKRPNPGYTIARVSEGLYGPKEVRDNSLAFLTTLVNMDALMQRAWREVAQMRLETAQQSFCAKYSSTITSILVTTVFGLVAWRGSAV